MSDNRSVFLLTYDLRARGTSSLYEFLYQSIREDIARGVIACGTKLPSKRVLARHLNIGVATVTAAYDQLITEVYTFRAAARVFCGRRVELPVETGNRKGKRASGSAA